MGRKKRNGKREKERGGKIADRIETGGYTKPRNDTHTQSDSEK